MPPFYHSTIHHPHVRVRYFLTFDIFGFKYSTFLGLILLGLTFYYSMSRPPFILSTSTSHRPFIILKNSQSTIQNPHPQSTIQNPHPQSTIYNPLHNLHLQIKNEVITQMLFFTDYDRMTIYYK